MISPEEAGKNVEAGTALGEGGITLEEMPIAVLAEADRLLAVEKANGAEISVTRCEENEINAGYILYKVFFTKMQRGKSTEECLYIDFQDGKAGPGSPVYDKKRTA